MCLKTFVSGFPFEGFPVVEDVVMVATIQYDNKQNNTKRNTITVALTPESFKATSGEEKKEKKEGKKKEKVKK